MQEQKLKLWRFYKMKYNFTRREVYMPEKYFRKDRCVELTPNENTIFSLLWINKDGTRS